jgi:hypothetical protein
MQPRAVHHARVKNSILMDVGIRKLPEGASLFGHDGGQAEATRKPTKTWIA